MIWRAIKTKIPRQQAPAQKAKKNKGWMGKINCKERKKDIFLKINKCNAPWEKF